jgi:hypothetical protein
MEFVASVEVNARGEKDLEGGTGAGVGNVKVNVKGVGVGAAHGLDVISFVQRAGASTIRICMGGDRMIHQSLTRATRVAATRHIRTSASSRHCLARCG